MAGTGNVLGFEQVTGLSAVKTLTIPTGTRKAIISAEGQNVRYRLDGTDPTASVGTLIVAGGESEEITVEGGLSASAKFIEVTTSATLSVHYYGKDIS